MTALLIALSILLVITFVLGLASYALFHPYYLDSLGDKIIFNVTAFPGVFAIFLPVMRGERSIMIPAYFVGFALSFAITTVLFHFIERGYWIYRSA